MLQVTETDAEYRFELFLAKVLIQIRQARQTRKEFEDVNRSGRLRHNLGHFLDDRVEGFTDREREFEAAHRQRVDAPFGCSVPLCYTLQECLDHIVLFAFFEILVVTDNDSESVVHTDCNVSFFEKCMWRRLMEA
jgi:hypothetical protein